MRGAGAGTVLAGTLGAIAALAACGPRASPGGGGSGTGGGTAVDPDVPRPAVCGNGLVEAPEQCDDGNTADGDGCQADCTYPPYHGERIVTGGGQCKCVVLPQGRLRCWGGEPTCPQGYAVGWEQTPAEVGDVPSPGPVEKLILHLVGGCAILADRRLWCWGYNSWHPARGTLGQGQSVDPAAARSLADALEVALPPGPVRAAAHGGYHGCAAMESGDLYCWGYNASGQLGYGDPDLFWVGDNETPAEAGPVDVGGKVVEVAIGNGGMHTCVLLEGGDVRCFGAQRMDPHRCGLSVPPEDCPLTGVLGTGLPDNVGDDEAPASVPPVEIGGPAVAIGATVNASCALRQDGKLYCWGQTLAFGANVIVGDDETPLAWGPVDEGVDDWALGDGIWLSCTHRIGGGWWCAGGELALFGWIERDWSERVELDALFGERVRGVARGAYLGSECVLLESGTVKCWGRVDRDNVNLEVFGYGMAPVYECDTEACNGDLPSLGSYCCVGASTPPWELPPVPYE